LLDPTYGAAWVNRAWARNELGRYPKKRKLSAAGRKRIVEATKKRWEAFKARKAAAQKAAVKMVKETKKRSASTDAVSAAPKVGNPAKT
jgi:ribosomal protein S8E